MYVSIEKHELSAHITRDGATLQTFLKLYDAYAYAAEHDLTVEPSITTARRLAGFRAEHPEHAAWAERNLALCPSVPVSSENPPLYPPGVVITLTQDPSGEWVTRDDAGTERKRSFNLHQVALSLVKRRVTPVVTLAVYHDLLRARKSVERTTPNRLDAYDAWLATFPHAETVGITPSDEPDATPEVPEPDTYALYFDKTHDEWVIKRNGTVIDTHRQLYDAVTACMALDIRQMAWTTVLDAAMHHMLRHLPPADRGRISLWRAEMNREWRRTYNPNRTLAGKESRQKRLAKTKTP